MVCSPAELVTLVRTGVLSLTLVQISVTVGCGGFGNCGGFGGVAEAGSPAILGICGACGFDGACGVCGGERM